MSTETTIRIPEAPKRLWFGFAAAALCWWGLAITNVLIVWRECLHMEQTGAPSLHPGLFWLHVGIFWVLILIAAGAGIVSYGNWHRLSGDGHIFHAEATGSHEYLAWWGVFISVTMGLGMIWFGIPLIILTLCERTR